MTDRIFAVTVLFEKDIREDDVEHQLNAIRMIKGVQAVSPHVTDHTMWAATERVKRELGQKLFAVLYPKEKQ